MGRALSIVAGAGLTAFTAWALGRLFQRRFPSSLFRQEEHLFAFLTGAGLLELLIFFLGLARLYYDVTFWVVAASAIAATLFFRLWRSDAPRLDPLPRAWQWFFGVVFGVFAFLYIVNAMAPEMSPDGSSYHLGNIGRYYREHRMMPITDNMYAQLSQGADLLFLMAYSFGRHSATALTHCLFLLALPLLILRYGQRQGLPEIGAAAALIAFVTPVLGIDGTSAYIDVAQAAVLFAVFYLCEIDDRRVALPLGLLAGFAYAIKYTAFLAVPYAMARKRRQFAVIAVVAAVLILPWIVRNSAWYGNPFAPLLNRAFPNPTMHLSFEQDYTELMQNYVGLKARSDIPLEATVRGATLGGLLGPLFLLTPLCLLSLGSSVGRRVLLAALIFASPYAANIGTRFLMPAVPFLALAFVIPWRRWPLVAATIAFSHALLSYPAVARLYCAPYAWRITKIPWRAALRLTPEAIVLQDVFDGYRTANLIDRLTPPHSIVFTFGGIPDGYTTRVVRTGYQSASNEKLRDIALTPILPDTQAIQRLEFRLPPQRGPRIRLMQTAGPARDVWSVHELRVYYQGRELPRRPEWRLRAHPNPWDVQLAFDNDRLTRWRSWQRIEPGMFLEIDFGREEQFDLVAVEDSPDQYGVRLRLEGFPNLAPVEVGLAPPLDLRRRAMEEFKHAGVTHLLVGPDDFGAKDYFEKQDLWDIRLAGSNEGTKLYKLE